MSNGGNGGASSTASSGDWICPDHDCRHLNFARRTQCNKCSRKKLGTEIGKAAAEKSRGLFSAEDWQCSKCANVNWARRQTCNMCNAPKFCDVEERTGYGGGYNDRGVVEYKEREDSDSEFDEFGRRKKRKADSDGDSRPKQLKQDGPKRNKDRIKGSDNDEEESEDDGDADLSKYDLWGDDDKTTSTKEVDSNNKDTGFKSDTPKRKLASRDSSSSSPSSSSTSSSSSSSSSSTTTTSTSSSASNDKCSNNAKEGELIRRNERATKNTYTSRYKSSRSRSRSPRSGSRRSRSRSRSLVDRRRR